MFLICIFFINFKVYNQNIKDGLLNISISNSKGVFNDSSKLYIYKVENIYKLIGFENFVYNSGVEQFIYKSYICSGIYDILIINYHKLPILYKNIKINKKRITFLLIDYEKYINYNDKDIKIIIRDFSTEPKYFYTGKDRIIYKTIKPN